MVEIAAAPTGSLISLMPAEPPALIVSQMGVSIRDRRPQQLGPQ
jgi:hypothetical protein